jgi:hypothetical protein
MDLQAARSLAVRPEKPATKRRFALVNPDADPAAFLAKMCNGKVFGAADVDVIKESVALTDIV